MMMLSSLSSAVVGFRRLPTEDPYQKHDVWRHRPLLLPAELTIFTNGKSGVRGYNAKRRSEDR